MAPPKPGIIPLRPLQFGEILDGAFQTIRRNAAAMVGSALIVQAVSQALLGVVSVAMLQTAQSLESAQSQTELNVLMGPLFGLMGGIMGITVLTGFLGAVLQGVLVVPVSRSVLDRRTGFKQMWKLAARRLPRLLGVAALLTLTSLLALAAAAGIAVALLMSMGPVALGIVIPLWLGAFAAYLWIAVKLMFAPAVVVVERVGIYEGLLRSWQLTKNSWWRIFGITLVVALMVGVIANIVQIPVTLATGGIGSFVSPHPDPSSTGSALLLTTVISTVVGVLVGSVTFAFQTSVSALIYMDLRMRRDGLDVDLMRLMETGGDAHGVPGTPAARGGSAAWPQPGSSWPSPGGQMPGAPQGPWPPA
ncbi:hypothetical protein AAHB33_13220 [Paenarthrobacter sp. S56]|uniref:hypothetical protein n=1 Tax=Paenarthrobacter sp. S56 TaxID=3138179 RepID=UPI0032197ED4